jgi:prolyl-tRNA synthetase
MQEAHRIAELLRPHVRAKLDDRDYLTPGRKFNEWELKGIPLRIELGPRDLKQGQAVLARRDTLEKIPVKLDAIEVEVTKMLGAIQQNLFSRATEFLKNNTRKTNSYSELKSIIAKSGGVVQSPWCGSADCEATVKGETGAKIINIPLEQDKTVAACVICGKPGIAIANFAKSY